MNLDFRKRWDESDRKLFEQTLAMLGHSPFERMTPPVEAVKAELEWLRRTLAEYMVERWRTHREHDGHQVALQTGNVPR